VKKGVKRVSPLLGTEDEIVGDEGIGESLQGLRIRTLQEGVGALLKVDVTLSQAQSQPVMLIETDAGREGEIGADPYKHLSPTRVLNIEVVLLDPTSLHLQMPTLVFPNSGHDGCGLTRFDDGHDLIGLGASEQNTIEATIVESDVMLMMVEEGVHGYLQCGETPEA
jgi:hypothetical protein